MEKVKRYTIRMSDDKPSAIVVDMGERAYVYMVKSNGSLYLSKIHNVDTLLFKNGLMKDEFNILNDEQLTAIQAGQEVIDKLK